MPTCPSAALHDRTNIADWISFCLRSLIACICSRCKKIRMKKIKTGPSGSSPCTTRKNRQIGIEYFNTLRAIAQALLQLSRNSWRGELQLVLNGKTSFCHQRKEYKR